MKVNNKGFSLVEIIIVIALLGIIAGILAGNNGYLTNSAVKGLSQSIKSSIGETRIKAMGKQQTVICIYKDASDGQYYKQIYSKVNDSVVAGEKDLLGKSYPEVKYMVGATEYTLDTSNYLLIGFDRSTGEEKAINIDIDGDGTDETSVVCNQITVNGAGVSRTITIVPKTGKVSL